MLLLKNGNVLNFLFCCRQIEGRVVEISQLQEIFSEKVLHQVSLLITLSHGRAKTMNRGFINIEELGNRVEDPQPRKIVHPADVFIL